MLTTFSKLTIVDKVSTWIEMVNRITSTIKLAVAPSKYDSAGKPLDGNDGYLSLEDKKKIDDLDITYMPIRGALPADATWKQDIKPIEKTDFYVTVESDNIILYNKSTNSSIEVVPATVYECATKYLCFLPSDNRYTLRLTNDGNTKEYNISRNPLILRLIFIGGVVVIEEKS